MNWQAVSFDWNQVRGFLATAEAGSLSAAAKALGQTQPTLGRQVSALEQDLGVTLFDRVGRSLVLTEAGRDLLVHVREMGEAASRVSLVASGQSQSVAGLVRISASDLVAARLLPPVLERLREEAPGVTVEIIASNAISDLMRREADIAIRHVRPHQPDLVARKCRSTSAQLFASTRYLDRRGRPRTAAELADHDFIGFSTAVDRMVAELNARDVPVAAANFRCIADSTVVGFELLQRGLGIALIFKDFVVDVPGMEPVLPEIAPFPVEVWLVTHREIHTSRRIRLVYDVLAEAFS
ncbi:LysR family transcriptional regulator [Devosia sp. RR2S18]|uniref:LysR family transcriptional regulator n=1 Tax=Devosia rhizosphaerae TaxID=3049774 RepID=UPI0025403A34|nr:LysR family transcriptional regulator [Devosia sp. RR2S18]WIJ24469.1 LysR family transcriptional regulator [Devosia sp. RR2S18]